MAKRIPEGDRYIPQVLNNFTMLKPPHGVLLRVDLFRKGAARRTIVCTYDGNALTDQATGRRFKYLPGWTIATMPLAISNRIMRAAK